MAGPDVVRRHFDETRAAYARYGSGLWGAYRRAAYRLLAARLPARDARLLDLGGGAMVSLPELLADPRTRDYVVVDLVDHLEPRPPKVSVRLNDIVDFAESYAGPLFDGGVIFGVLMYLPAERAERLLGLLPKLLRPGAALVVHEPNASAAPHLDQTLERPVDVAEIARTAGLELLARRRYNVPAVRAVSARLDRLLGPLAPSRSRLGSSALLGLEGRLDCGLDTLYLLRRPEERR